MLPFFAAGLIFVGAGAWIYRELQQQAGAERERWRSKRAEVERSIKWHEKQIRNHLSDARKSCDFKVLIDMHFSCMKVADQAYLLLKDARVSQRKIGEAIGKTKEQLDRLFLKKREAKSINEKSEIQSEISSIQQLREKLFKDRDDIGIQKEKFESKVKDLNLKTHDLKNMIRDRTGSRGRDWYMRLEERKKLNKK